MQGGRGSGGGPCGRKQRNPRRVPFTPCWAPPEAQAPLSPSTHKVPGVSSFQAPGRVAQASQGFTVSLSAETWEEGGRRKASEGMYWAETGKMARLSWHEVCVPSSQGLWAGWAPWPGLQCQDPTLCWLALHSPRFPRAPVPVVALCTRERLPDPRPLQLHCLISVPDMDVDTGDTASDQQPCKLRK